ncbi:MAG: B12-binding domain-containing radical SAM protein, partial [Clostridiales bacterium]|nr:B12-binding domain-containing radical SAM protein [Clostridiales bacterium]
MNWKKTLDRLLPQAEKPARYTGGELHQAIKDPASCHTRFGFAFPDTYEIGMSYLGLQIIYHVLNKEEGVYCERLFAPASDMEDLMRQERVPLFTLETQTPAKEMDIIGFTLQYEMSFTNILNMLDLAGIPMRSAERGEDDPIIAAGGPCAFNPEPLADFIDFFMIGDGEEVLPEVCRVHKEWKESGEDREGFLKRLSAVE